MGSILNFLADLILENPRTREEKQELKTTKKAARITKAEIAVEEEEQTIINISLKDFKLIFDLIKGDVHSKNPNLDKNYQKIIKSYNSIIKDLNKLHDVELSVIEEIRIVDSMLKYFEEFNESLKELIFDSKEHPEEYPHISNSKTMKSLVDLDKNLDHLIKKLKELLVTEGEICKKKIHDFQIIIKDETIILGR